MKKKMYRIALYKYANDVCEKLCSLAAKFNGGENKLTLSQLATLVNAKAIEYPSLYGDCKPELIGENLLHVELKIGSDIHTIMSIEEVEILELEVPELTPSMAKELLDQHHDEVDAPPSPEPPHEAPTLHRYD